jgi:hypothetical protein
MLGMIEAATAMFLRMENRDRANGHPAFLERARRLVTKRHDEPGSEKHHFAFEQGPTCLSERRDPWRTHFLRRAALHDVREPDVVEPGVGLPNNLDTPRTLK